MTRHRDPLKRIRLQHAAIVSGLRKAVRRSVERVHHSRYPLPDSLPT
jgi:hypothetical protein